MLQKTINYFSAFMIFVLLISFTEINAQGDKIPKSLKSKVSQNLGTDTEITFTFSRPGVKGRTIWGELVPFGMEEGNKYSDNKPYPWRMGANENSTIETNKDLLVEGQKLPAGKYGLHAIPGKDEWTIMFSKNNSLWGSYKYNSEEDALTIKVKPQEAPHQEWLTFGFTDLEGTSATAYMHWEKLMIPFKVQIAE